MMNTNLYEFTKESLYEYFALRGMIVPLEDIEALTNFVLIMQARTLQNVADEIDSAMVKSESIGPGHHDPTSYRVKDAIVTFLRKMGDVHLKLSHNMENT